MISSTAPYEFHNSANIKQPFRKRPFDQNASDTEQTVDNTYKKIKTSSSSVNSLSSQQTTKSMKISFASPSHMETNIYPRYYENDIEPNLLSDTPRIIDLSTGETLESISSVDQLRKNRKSKRPVELTELSRTMKENKGDLIPKRIRTSREHMCNFIEEEEEIDPNAHRPVDVMKEFKIGYNTLSSNKANSLDSQKKPQSLSLYVHGKNPTNIKFTVPYQKAIARHMRSQFQHLNNNEENESEGKELILYRPRNNVFEDSFVNSSGKIFEIPEETMDFDVEAGQNSTFDCINNLHYVEEEDQMEMDID